MTVAAPERFVAVDIGSNATKVKTWVLAGGEATQIDFMRHPMRLGDSAFRTGEISGEIVDRLIALLGSLPAGSNTIVRAVATSAMRDAKNGNAVRNLVRERTGIDIRIIEGKEEARLMALGALGANNRRDRISILIDIGGGSTEIIVTRGTEIILAHSMPLGAVRLRGQCYPTANPPSADQIQAADGAVACVLDKELSSLTLPPADQAIGLAGTITTLHRMVRHEDSGLGDDAPISLTRIKDLRARLASLTFAQIVALFPVEPDRAEVILAGAQILTAVLRRLGVHELHVAYQGVCDGLLREYLAQL